MLKIGNTQKMPDHGYIMEGEEESVRLDVKTDPKKIKELAIWAGLKPGMRIADLACGSGKSTFYLNRLAQPYGAAVGVDISRERIKYAREHYLEENIEYHTGDICKPLDMLGLFDFVWIRFALEYHLSDSFDIVKNASSILKPGGVMCLIDLDLNCLNHYGLPKRLERALYGIMSSLESKANFDPYSGRKLYSYLYDLEYEQIDVRIDAHHCIFGELKDTEAFNWTKKVEIAAKNSGYQFIEYEEKFEGFLKEFRKSFFNPRRFTYTPAIICRGHKS